MPLIFQRNSYYNYGTVSPNNIFINVNTYNTGSYTGSGTVWRDLSVYGNNMTLNSTSFTGSIGQNGGISFNGINSYAISSNSLINYLTSSNFNQTQEVWIKNVYYTTTGTQGVIIDEIGALPAGSGWHATQFEIIGNTGTISVWDGSLTKRINLGLINDQNWHHIGWRYESSGVLSGYLDGIKKGSVNVTRQNVFPNYYPALGLADTTNMGNGSYYKGLIGVYRSYNRAINDREVLQNYNYEKQFFSPLSFSAFFNYSSSQYLSVSASSDWAVGTGNFTIEWWQNMGTSSTYPRIFSVGGFPSASLSVSIESGTFYLWLNGSSFFSVSLSNYLNQWVHFSVVRNGTTITAYQNGTSISSSTSNANITNTTSALNIGSEGAVSNTYFGGYISQFRWTNSAVYTSNFPKPTSILQPLSQTKLLLLFSSSSELLKDSSGLNKTVTNNNGVTWNISKPF